jgi:hypothetical protein
MDLDTVDEKYSETPAHLAAMRRVALLLDGMARAIILPFGPSLVYRLVHGTSEAQPSQWSGASYFSFLVSVYILGRWLGAGLLLRFERILPSEDNLSVYVARLGGALLSLHLITYGAGLSRIRVLLLIRFLSAVLAGFLCGITRSIKLPEDDRLFLPDSLGEERLEATRRRAGYVDIASGSAKIYLTGFMVSILSGGLLFRSATRDSTFRKLTGYYQYTWSPLFLIAVAVTTEIVLRKIFAWVETTPNYSRDLQMDDVPLFPENIAFAGSTPSAEDDGKFDEFLDPLISEYMPNYQEPSSPMTSPLRSRIESPLRPSHDSPLRSRHDSYTSFTSFGDFHDCRSVFSETESPMHHLSAQGSVDEMEVALYVDGRCQYADGTPAFVPPGDCVANIPDNYLKIHKQNANRAQAAWDDTQAWREENDVWRIHTVPHPWFAKIKKSYPHCVHGHSKAGYPVVYENPGKMDLKSLLKTDCRLTDMIHHYIFFQEYLAHRVCNVIRSKMGSDTVPPSSSAFGTMVVSTLQRVV